MFDFGPVDSVGKGEFMVCRRSGPRLSGRRWVATNLPAPMLTDQRHGCSRLVETPDSTAVANPSLVSGNGANAAGVTQTSRGIEAMHGGGSLQRLRKMALPAGGAI